MRDQGLIPGCKLEPHRPLSDQSGMVAVIALLVMVVLSILGLSFLGSSLTEGQIGSNESDLRKAFFAAEAGIQEAIYRMRLDPAAPLPGGSDESDTTCTTSADPIVVGEQGSPAPSWADPTNANFWKYNPPTCAWSYSNPNPPVAGDGNYFGGTNKANLDSAGRTFSSTGAAHATGGQLVNANITNTTSDPRSFTAAVAPVVGFVGGCWQYVDQFGVPLGSCGTVASNPMFKVTSTGTAKNSQKVLSTIIQRFNISYPKGTVEANTNINVQSAAAIIDGKNYACDGNTYTSDNNLPAATTPTGTAGISINKPENLQCDAGTGTTNCGGTSGTFPDTIGGLLLRGSTPPATQSQIDALNSYLESVKIDPVAHPEQLPTSAFHGILYVDGNYAKPPDGSRGLLIVHHRNASNQDVATLGNFNEGTFKGLIIADKINKINGNAQVIGAIFGFGNGADGVTVDDVTGTPTIKYSKCALDTYGPPAFPYQIVSGTWHEQ